MNNLNRSAASCLLVILVVLTSGCASLQFYQQAVSGQSRLLMQRESTQELLASDISPELRRQLELADEILDFAQAFGLESGGVYSSYTETGRPYVVWNVFAAEPLELSLKTSCFPVAGCVSYRGYFSEQAAEKYAASLRAEGYDVYVAGVVAYSTLGWFKDPLLDTFLFYPDEYLAALLFHELAHQIVYVKGDTRFNESMATAVEQFVLERYLISRGDKDMFERYLASRARRAQVITLINDVRDQLRLVYTSDLSRQDKLAQKAIWFSELVARYERLTETWEEGSEYRRWMQSPMSNAKLETVADYHEWVPGMLEKLESLGFDGFVTWLNQLAALTFDERKARLQAVQPKSE